MIYPNCQFRCNGLLNCQQLDHLLVLLCNQEGREDVVDIYQAMLNRNYKNCPLNRSHNEYKKVVSMY